jgi:cytochrome P450
VDNAIGFDREPCLSDRGKCPLADAVILETLRYISHIPLAAFHSASEDTTIAGYTIKKDTVVSTIAHFVHFHQLFLDACFYEMIKIISISTSPEILNAGP